jgi:hypothetical protein
MAALDDCCEKYCARSFYIGYRQNYRSRNGVAGGMGYNMYENKALA